MENQESNRDNRHLLDDFYKKEVRLEEGIEISDLFSGKGATFTVKQDDELLVPEPLRTWDTSEISAVGIDPEVHKGGAFKGIEKDFTEKLTEDGLVLKQLIKAGSGPIVPSRAWVKIHYSTYAEGHDEPIDSTRLRARPHDFILGDGVNILALDIAVSSMKKKERAKFLADPQYCYGKMGVPPRIPRNARLLFDIEVVHFVDENMINEYDALSPDDRRDIPQDKILILAAELREKGNENYKKNSRVAYNSYMKAIKVLEGHAPKDETEEIQLHGEKIKTLLNLAQSCLDHSRTVDCRRYAGEAASLLNNEAVKNAFKSGKAHYIIHKSYMKEQKLSEAKRALEEAVRHVPDDTTIREAFVRLEKAQARENVLERSRMDRMGEKLGWKGEGSAEQ